MKSWVRILMWIGLGAGIGFFAGERVGEKIAMKKLDDEPMDIPKECEPEEENIDDKLEEYRGYEDLSTEEGLDRILKEPITDEEDEVPEMPMEEPVIDEEEPHVVPQLHPTQMLPEIVTEEEYMQNPWDYEEERLVFYETDEVLYNCTTQDIVQYPDNVLGVGTLYEFRAGPGEPKDTLFVINEIFGTRFRVDRIEAAFQEEVDATVHPEDDPPEEEDEYWDDV